MHSRTRRQKKDLPNAAAPTARSNVKPGGSASSPEAAAGLHPSHAEIAARAETLWREKGLPQGRDVETWLEAERQLKAEFLERIKRDEIMLADPRFAFNRDSNDVIAELNERFPGNTGKEPTSL